MNDDTQPETEDEPSVPAEDPGIPLWRLYLSQYIPVEAAFIGDIRDPKVKTQLKQKAADIALALTGILTSQQRGDA